MGGERLDVSARTHYRLRRTLSYSLRYHAHARPEGTGADGRDGLDRV